MKKQRMSKRIIAALILAAVVSLSLCASVPTGAANITDATIQGYEKQIADLQKQQDDLADKIATAQRNKASALSIKYSLDQKIALSQQKIEAVEKLLAELEKNIEEKNLSIDDLQAKIDRQFSNLKERIRISYEEGDVSYVELVLGAKNLSEFLRNIDYVGNMLEYDTRLMNEYRDNKENLEAAREELRYSLDAQDVYYNQLEEEKANLQTELNGNDKFLAQQVYTEQQAKEEHDKLQKEEAELDAKLTAYIKELQAKMNKQYVGGTFGWPVDTSITYISSYYGWRTYYYRGVQVTDFHGGIDLPATTGTSIYAANGGTVITATYHSSYGNYVLIDHGGGRATLYAHCSKLLVTVNQEVSKGDVIAQVGTTGNSTGPHLHFEVRIDGSRVDPLSNGYVVVPGA